MSSDKVLYVNPETKDVITSGSIYAADGVVGTPSFTFTNDTNTGLYRPANDALGLVTGGTEKVRVDANGNMGIGINNPQAKLHVNGRVEINGVISSARGLTPAISFSVSQADSKLQLYDLGGTNWSGLGVDANGIFWLRTGIAGTKLLVMNPSGFVGIGLTNPQHPLDVAFSTNTSSMSGRYMDLTAAGSFYTGLWPVSIKAIDWIWATTGFTTSSDTRIKTNIQDIDDGVALSQLRLLKPKTYEYIDKVQRGADPVIGFIAQEVAEVLPRAVTKQTEIIPSIYAIASVVNGIIQLDKAHDLVIGDKVKLMPQHGGELLTNVKEVLSSFTFTSENEIEDGRVFVYGKEVTDFHTLDKNAIFTIGVAAMQEIDRTVQALIERVAILESKLNLQTA